MMIRAWLEIFCVRGEIQWVWKDSDKKSVRTNPVLSLLHNSFGRVLSRTFFHPTGMALTFFVSTEAAKPTIKST